jgi:ribonucleoside-diphosphate reductase beta chain
MQNHMPRSVLVDASMFKALTPHHIRALHRSAWDHCFPLTRENPFPWMSEMIDLKRSINFFETA